MQFTNYFLHTQKRPDRKIIKMEWIQQVYDFPEHEQTQSDARTRKWGYIEEAGRYLRIVVMEDGVTVHNAFFDRDYKR
jgi:hypothetical protein